MTLLIKPNSVEEKSFELNQKLCQLHKQLSTLFREKETYSPWIDVPIADVKIRQLCWLVDGDPSADTYSLFSRDEIIDPIFLGFNTVRELEIDRIKIPRFNLH